MKDQRYIPEVKFEIAPVESEAEYLYFFSRTERRFAAVMDRVYPELEGIIGKTNDKDEAILKCREFAEKVVDSNVTAIIEAKDRIQDDWKLVSDEFLETLAQHFETEWPEDRNVITGYISIVPIFPRFPERYSFNIGYRVNTAVAREVIAHEILHLLWFKKWGEVFPEIPGNEYESPHLTWRLSEVMDQIILQCQPEMKSLIQPTSWGYPSFKDLKIGDISMTEYFMNVYVRCVQEGLSFEQSLKILWKEAQERKDILEKF